MSSGGGGGTQTIQKADPWSGIQPYLNQLYGSSANWFNTGGPQYYPEATITGQAPATIASQQGTINRALQGNPLVPEAQNYYGNQIAGNSLYSNPAMSEQMAAAGGYYLPGAAGQNPWLDKMYGSAAQGKIGRASCRERV